MNVVRVFLLTKCQNVFFMEEFWCYFAIFYVIKSNGELFELGMGCQTRTKD